MISGRNFASSGEVSPTSTNRPPTIGSRRVRHDSSSSLRCRTPRPAHHGVPPDEAQEDVLEVRPHSFEGGQPDAARDHDAAADPAEAASASVTDTTISAALVSSTRSTHGARAERADEGRDGGVLAGFRVQPVQRQRVSREQSIERPLGDEAAVIEDRDPVADPLDVGQHVGREDDRGPGRAGRR